MPSSILAAVAGALAFMVTLTVILLRAFAV